MKNQYFGDVNDYLKYGLLRALGTGGGLTLSVGWMLTRDDDTTHGSTRGYLRDPRGWRRYDPVLFDHLETVLADGTAPSVAMIEQSHVLPQTSFFSEVVPDDRSDRAAWGERLVEASANADLIFLDPDNGMEVQSKAIGRKGSSKYAAWHEVEQLWAGGSSLLIYQHFPRRKHHVFVSERAEEFRCRIGAPFVESFCTRRVVFFLVAQEHHRAAFGEAIGSYLPKWHGKIAVGCPCPSDRGCHRCCDPAFSEGIQCGRQR